MKAKLPYETEEELEASAPLLFGIPKVNPFVVPDSYFENLPILIQEKCQKKPSLRERLSNYFQSRFFALITVKYQWAYATAILVLAIGFGYTYFQKSTESNTIVAYEQLNSAALVDYLDEEVLSEAVVNEDPMLTLPGGVLPEEEKLQIEDYLINENIDVTLISQTL